MGHGTSHTAKVSYSQMQTTMETLGYDNVFIGTVEGEPEDTACEAVIEKVKEAGYTKVVLRPLMVVAGDHANNDMAGADEDSWLSQFNAAGCFDSVDTQIAGLGEIADIQQIYVNPHQGRHGCPERLIFYGNTAQFPPFGLKHRSGSCKAHAALQKCSRIHKVFSAFFA